MKLSWPKKESGSAWKILNLRFLSWITIHTRASAVTACTSGVVSNNQDSMVRPLAGAVVLDDSTQVILPAYSIHDGNQGAMLHQLTHHGLLLTTEEE